MKPRQRGGYTPNQPLGFTLTSCPLQVCVLGGSSSTHQEPGCCVRQIQMTAGSVLESRTRCSTREREKLKHEDLNKQLRKQGTCRVQTHCQHLTPGTGLEGSWNAAVAAVTQLIICRRQEPSGSAAVSSCFGSTFRCAKCHNKGNKRASGLLKSGRGLGGPLQTKLCSGQSDGFSARCEPSADESVVRKVCRSAA